MTYKIKRIVSILCLAAAICSVTLLPASVYAENLRFVFMADSRGNDPVPPNPIINTAVLDAINTKILALPTRPSFVIFGGDQAYRGCIDGKYTFDDFKTAMKRLTDAGITLYTAMGNHELYVKGTTDDQGFILANQQEFQTAFQSNPSPGPTPAYDKLVYSFESSGHDAFFAVLDPYFLTADVPSPNLDGTIDAPQLSWLTDQLAQTKATHKFVFSHAPYYKIYYLSTGGMSYTNLWHLLDQNRVDIFFCGHTHLFSRKNIDPSIAPDPQLSPPVTWNSNVFQVITGTCGVQADGGTPARDAALWHVSNAADTYYFSVVDINGSNVKVTTYSGNTGDYSVLDTFNVNKSFVPANYLLLLD